MLLLPTEIKPYNFGEHIIELIARSNLIGDGNERDLELNGQLVNLQNQPTIAAIAVSAKTMAAWLR